MLVVDSGIKHAFMLLYAYIVFCIGLPEKHSRRRYFFGGAAAVLIGGSMLVLKNYIFVIAIPSLMALFYLAEGMIFHVRPKKNLTPDAYLIRIQLRSLLSVGGDIDRCNSIAVIRNSGIVRFTGAGNGLL